jgi:hypothetical protein
MTATVAFAQKGKHPPPPPPPPPLAVIAKVTASKKIFVSNAGADTYFVHDIPGGANVTYDEFYAALKQWGYFELVDSTRQADLIFQIQGTEQLPDVENDGRGVLNKNYSAAFYPPMLNLSILDPSTRDLLYKIVLPAGRGSNIPRGKIAFTQSIDALTAQIKALVAAPPPTQNP